MGATAGPEIQRAFATHYAGLAAVLLLVPGIIALVLEPVLFLIVDRWARHRAIAGSLGVLALGATAAALAPGPITLAIAVAGMGVAAGLACGLAEAALVDANPARRASTMTRWMLLGLVGDVLAPIVVLGIDALGGTWRAGYGVVALVVGGWATLVALRPMPGPGPGPTPEVGSPPRLAAVLVRTLRDRRLVAWLFALVLCDLLDEILVILGALRLRDDLGAGPAWRGALIAAFVVGGAAALVVVDRLLLRVAARRILVGSGVACAIAYTAWLTAPTPAWAVAGMVVVGATAAPLYPLASAQALAATPERSGAVLAASHLFTPIALALPWLLGVVADRAGLTVALALLLAQPIGLAVLAAAWPIDRGDPAVDTADRAP